VYLRKRPFENFFLSERSMDAILFSRLKSFLVTKIGPDLKSDIAAVVTWTMDFIENQILSKLASNEKLSLCLNWVKAVLAEGGTTLSTEVESIITSFINLICSITNGSSSAPSINASATVVAAPTTAVAVVEPVPAKKARKTASIFSR
jgi:hypothetical protein